jgi:hypothetical protein
VASVDENGSRLCSYGGVADDDYCCRWKPLKDLAISVTGMQPADIRKRRRERSIAVSSATSHMILTVQPSLRNVEGYIFT